MTEENEHKRTIRSYVKRLGRMTSAQKEALETLMPTYGVSYCAEVVDWISLFGREAPTILHIGFGMGEGLLELAEMHPAHNYLGIEVHEPGVGSLLHQIPKKGIKNIRVVMHDAVEVLQNMIADDSLMGVELFFPDPWPKKRHHKRRIVSHDFNQWVAQKLKVGGYFHLATDWEPYAEWMMEHLLASSLVNQYEGATFAERGARPLTRFEARGHRLGHGVWDLMFKKKDVPMVVEDA